MKAKSNSCPAGVLDDLTSLRFLDPLLTRHVTKMLALVLLPVALPLSLSSQAETKAERFEISPFVGYNFFESNQNLKDSFVYGGRVGYNFTENFALEGSVGFVDSRVKDTSIVGEKKGQYRSPVDDVDLIFYNADVLYHFKSESQLTPFVVAGFGGTNYSPRVASRDMSTFNVGVGAKYWVNDDLAIRLDLRDYFVSEVFSNGYNNIQATLGVVFAFGGRATPERQAEVRPAPVVRVAGYTSAAGTAEYNQELSERRARAIQEFLISEGIQPNRLSVIGYGDTRPVQHEANPQDLRSEAAKANMRVLFEIVVQ